MAKSDSYLPLLLYYKSEKENPYPLTDIRATYWTLERTWVKEVAYVNDVIEFEYMGNFMDDFPDLLANISRDLPTSLKGFMYDQYCHVGGSKEGFPIWFRNYVDVKAQN